MAMSPEALAKAHAGALRTIATWSDERRVDWEEWAAILEYERGNTRQDAELIAYWHELKRRGR